MSQKEFQALAAAAGEQPPAFDFSAPQVPVLVVGTHPSPKAFWS